MSNTYLIKMKLPIVIICLFLGNQGFSQNQVVDSLKNALGKTTDAAEQLLLYQEILRNLQFENTDSSSHYLDRGMALAKKVNDKAMIALFTNTRALILERTSSREAAIAQYQQSLKLFSELEDTVNIVKVHAALVSRYNEIGNVEKALEHYQKAIAILPADNLQMRASLNNRIGTLYGMQRDMETAMRYFRLNLPLFGQLQNDYGLGFTNMNIGIIHDELGHTDSALYYLEKGLYYHRLSGKTQALAGNLAELASFYINRNLHENALNYILEAIQLMEPLNAPYYLVSLYSRLTLVYQKMGEEALAIQAGEKGLALAESTQDYDAMKDLLGILANSYAANGDYQEAYLQEVRRAAIRDTLYNQNNIKLTEELEQKYQAEQKQAQIDLQNERLSRQRILLIGFGVIAALIAALAFFAYRAALQRKRINQQLRQLDHTKSRFFSNISHELRTPLTLILSPLENAIEKTKNSLVEEDLTVAKNNGQKLLNLVNEIMDLSKLEVGKLVVHNSNIALAGSLERIFSAYGSMARLRGISWQFDNQVDAEMIVKTDLAKLEKILNNLLSNALKFTPTGGTVSLKSKMEDHQLHLEVKDTGPGIPPEELKHIFDRFYQSKTADAPIQGGTGIGLALAKELCELLQGNLYVRSEVGEGSIFSVQIPVEIRELEASISEPAIQMKEPAFIPEENTYTPVLINGEKPKILIVEDNPEMNHYLNQILKKEYSCTQVYDGQQALEKLKTEAFDLVTSDVMMPNMDGYTFKAQIKKLYPSRRMAFIMLTALSLEENKLKGLQLGVDDYITKPFSAKELKARIRNLLLNKAQWTAWSKGQTPETTEIPVSVDTQLLQKAEKTVINQLTDPDFKVEQLATALNFSKRQLSRVIRELTGMSPNQFIREIRLLKAYELLENRQVATVAEAAFAVGFEHRAYFSSRFQERFGKKPGEFLL